MNPVVASSIISLGKDLIEKISTPQNTISVPESSNPKPFVSELEDAQSTSLEKPKQIYAKLDEKELKTMLLEEPTVASFAEANPNSQIFLQKRADGSIQLCSSSGQTLVLDKSTTTNQIAVSYFEKSLTSENNQSAHHPGAVYLIK